jgi:hypothetical protein
MGTTFFLKIGRMAMVAVCVPLLRPIYHLNEDRILKTLPLNVYGLGLYNPEDMDWKRLMFCACHP